jgi:hypothetical protein
LPLFGSPILCILNYMLGKEFKCNENVMKMKSD